MFDLKKFLEDTATNVGNFFGANRQPASVQKQSMTPPQPASTRSQFQQPNKNPSRPLATINNNPVDLGSFANDVFKNLNNFGNDVNKNVIQPAADFAGKAANTVGYVPTAVAGELTNNNEIRNLANTQLKNSLVTPDIAQGTASPLQFAQKFTDAGVQASNFLPVKGAVTGLANGLTRQAIGRSLLSNAGQAGVLGTANTINDVSQGRGVNPQSLLTNYAAPLALGAGSEIAGGAVRSIANNVRAPRPPTNLTNDELNVASRVREAQEGYRSTSDITEPEINVYKQIQSKLGQQPGTVEAEMAVRDALGAHTNYDRQVAAGVAPTTNLVQRANDTARRLIPAASLEPNAPRFNPNEYINTQSSAQDAARVASTNSFTTNLRNEVSTKLIDSFSPIERTLAKANKDGANINIGDSNNITTQIDRALRADTIGGQYIKDNGLADIIQQVPDTKAFDQYLIARHAKDLEANGVKTGRNLDSDAQLVNSLSPEYERYAQQVKQYSDNLLDKTVDYGLISKELADTLKEKYPNYVPANRIFDESELSNVKGQGGGKASRSTQTVVQRIKGSDREIESPLASLTNKTIDVFKQGESNKAASILASYKDLEGNPFNLRELKPDETVGTKSTISYIDNGKVRRFETTPEIAAAAKALNKEQMGLLGRIVSIPTRALRLGATGINPGFALANVSKDLVSAAVNSKHPLRTSLFNADVTSKAAKAAFNHNSKEYAELVREGAGGTSFDIARDAPRQNVANIRSGKNRFNRAGYVVTHPGELLRAVENTIGRSEEFVRALQYYGNKDAALAKNMSKDDATRYAAHAARNNSVNFARAGEYGAVLNSALPYLNAGIQGARNLNRNIRDRPAQTLGKIGVLSTLPVVSVTAWNLSDEKRKEAYNQISDYEKQGNLIIVPPDPKYDEKTGQWNVIKIPLSPDLASLNSIARKAIEQGNESGDLKVTDIIGSLVNTGTSIDISSGRALANKVIPQALKPGIETLTNQNLFTGNKIIPESQRNLPANEQFGDYTSGTAKTLGNLTGGSPRVIDNAIKSSTGGAGQNAINFSDSLLAGLGVIKPEEVQGKSIGQSIGGRFYGASQKQASDEIADTFKRSKDALVKTDGYKSLSQQEKAKALNRLETDIKALGYAASDARNPNSKYEAKPLTANQKSLQAGERKLEDYLAPTTPGATKKQTNAKLASSNDAEYKDLQSKYNKNVKEGNYTTAQKIRAEAELNKAKIGAQFSKTTRDYYGLSKAQLTNIVTTDPNGKAILDDVLKYGDALKESGLAEYNKFKDKNGNISLAKAKTSGKSGSKKGRKIDYASSIASINSTGINNGKALQAILKRPKITRKKINGGKV